MIGMAGQAVISARARGSDLVATAGVVNKMNYIFVGSPSVKTPEDLKGKRIGISRVGLNDEGRRAKLRRGRVGSANGGHHAETKTLRCLVAVGTRDANGGTAGQQGHDGDVRDDTGDRGRSCSTGQVSGSLRQYESSSRRRGQGTDPGRSVSPLRIRVEA